MPSKLQIALAYRLAITNFVATNPVLYDAVSGPTPTCWRIGGSNILIAYPRQSAAAWAARCDAAAPGAIVSSYFPTSLNIWPDGQNKSFNMEWRNWEEVCVVSFRRGAWEVELFAAIANADNRTSQEAAWTVIPEGPGDFDAHRPTTLSPNAGAAQAQDTVVSTFQRGSKLHG